MSILVFDDSDNAYEVGVVAMDQEGNGLGQGADLGDTLVVPSEGIVAVATLYPFAVTEKRGAFKQFGLVQPVFNPVILKKLVDAIQAAVSEAERRGFPLNSAFKAFSSGENSTGAAVETLKA